MADNKIEEIALEDLLIDTQNPRAESQTNQRETLTSIARLAGCGSHRKKQSS